MPITMKEICELDGDNFYHIFGAAIDIVTHARGYEGENAELDQMLARAKKTILKMIKANPQKYNEKLNMAMYDFPVDPYCYCAYFSNGMVCTVSECAGNPSMLFAANEFKPTTKIQKLIDEAANGPTLAEKEKAKEEARVAAAQKKAARSLSKSKYAFSIGKLRRSYSIINLQLQLKLYGKKKAEKFFPKADAAKYSKLLDALYPQIKVLAEEMKFVNNDNDDTWEKRSRIQNKAKILLTPFDNIFNEMDSLYDALTPTWEETRYFSADQIQPFLDKNVYNTDAMDKANKDRWYQYTAYSWAENCIRDKSKKIRTSSTEESETWGHFCYRNAGIARRYIELMEGFREASIPQDAKDFLIERGYLSPSL